MGLKIAVFVALVLGFLLRKPLANWARYLYFLRFAILLWFFPLLLVWANTTGARSLVSGVVTPARSVQYLCVAFFLVSSSFVALILARIVVINGAERYGGECPALLNRLLADEGEKSVCWEWLTFVACQLNNLIVFGYLLVNGGDEGVYRGEIARGLAGGAGCSLLFWYAVNAIYYLTYRPAAGSGESAAQIGRAAARTLLFPRSWLLMSRGAERTGAGDVLEVAELRVSIKWIRGIFQVAGYRWAPKGDLYEGHYLSLLAAFGFVALYLALWPLTAPVPVERWSLVSVVVYILGGVLIAAAVWTARIEEPDESELRALSETDAKAKRTKHAGLKRGLRGWKIALTIAVLGFAAVIPALYYKADAERFPILALVLILVISSSWVLAGVAFFADRYRIPVLTTVLALAVIPRMLHWDAGKEEHYLSTTPGSAAFTLPTPRGILLEKLTQDPDKPLIVVTSTGGGIHAAAWTTAVLGKLEDEFGGDQRNLFRDHLLLMSTVSGGSSGLYAYLREVKDANGAAAINSARMLTVASCSSLEAVGWGLVYFDIPKAFVPFLPYLKSPSPGSNDLTESPLFKDRTWALRRAFGRNLSDPFCAIDPNTGREIPVKELKATEKENESNETGLTLENLPAKEGKFPAFSMNTTTVENGERFLLANYRIPDGVSPEPGLNFRARSFLATFGTQADLPLATAAQLSAVFPYVSSQARVPLALDSASNSVHFADGGYYDNDGTATAIEFLRYALTAKEANDKSPAGKVRVLLIEIRNSDELQGSPGDKKPDRTYDANGDPEPLWNLLSQAVGPLEGFWNAGHESDTARDQAGLELLQRAYGGQLELHAIVIGDVCAKTRAKTDPLNWSLTPVQQKEVAATSSSAAMMARYAKAREWFDAPLSQWENAAGTDDQLPQADQDCH
jgi:hypothetical protein